jgi:hypothetical protein
MKLVHNWRSIVARSHSMWAFYLSFVALVVPEILFLVLGYDIASPRFWWGVGVALLGYGIIGRIKDQGIGDAK